MNRTKDRKDEKRTKSADKLSQSLIGSGSKAKKTKGKAACKAFRKGLSEIFAQAFFQRTCASYPFFILSVVALLVLYTSSLWGATVSGKVEIEGRKDLSGVLVTVQERNLSGVTGSDGTYSIPNVPTGSFTLTAQKAGCLVEVSSDVVVTDEPVAVNFKLIPGDLKIDNQINLLDRIMLTSAWQARKGDPNWNIMLDIQEDGVIDEKDRDLLLSHWRKGNPAIKLGSLEISSEPDGAIILINGADTGRTTPYTFQGMVVGRYNVTLALEGYPSWEEPQTVEAGRTTLVSPILDDQPPEFADWAKDPEDLNEDTQGRFRVSVRVVDRGGSGLQGKIPEFDYRIDDTVTYNGYENMTRESGDIWYFDIPEPAGSWNALRGEFVYFKVRAEDVAGNVGESDEQSERIDDINDPPTVRITSTFDRWETGLLTIAADASDPDGTVASVLFEYSLDNARWTQIGSTDTTRPYSVPWDTTAAVREVAQNVWIRATVTDDDNASEHSTTPSFGIDNQPSITTHDYDGLWHNADFVINLRADDGNGIGVATISYRLNFGNKQDVQIDGQASASVRITTESHSNVLEYWSVDELGNEESHKTLSNIRLDKTDPLFSDWAQDPGDLTEDALGRFRVSVQVADGDGSGLEGKVPQFDYHIGSETQYDGYEDMVTEDGKVWYFDIPEPVDTWDAHRGQNVHYKVRAEDVAGNTGESIERTELIEDVNDPPVVSITSRFDPWEKGLLTIEAAASDTDGEIDGVQFEYSSDKQTWAPIGSIVAAEPFSVEWDTTASIPQAQTVWIQATATDDSGSSVTHIYPTSVGVDNQSPTTGHDYDDLWHTTDFLITLTASDGNGIGVSPENIRYKLNDGPQKNVSSDGQPSITEEGISQLEYWSIDDLGNAETHGTLRNIKLDKTAPMFADWIQDPPDLNEDSTGFLRVSVRVIDAGESGLAGKVPQLRYRIGRDGPDSGYQDMTKGGTDDVWYYDIPEPAETWNAHRGKNIFYRARAEDVAGNEGESEEQTELINDINDPPVVSITSSYSDWESGSLTIEAESSDPDGTITSVRFGYSLDKVDWKPIGDPVTAPPYSIVWDTTEPIPEVERTVWIRATATDDDGQSVENIISKSLRIDNKPPVTTDDYDGLWHKEDFVINLKAGDGNGVGVESVLYKLNQGDTFEVPINGQLSIPVMITTEGPDNVLEYWSVDKLGNEGTHKTLSDIKLDKTVPLFSDWQQDPADLTEDAEGRFRVSVQATDEGGSGLKGKIPQIDYHIGAETPYDGYENMTSDTQWHFDIPEPEDTWDAHRDEQVFYKVRLEDVAGNVTESGERKELIDSVNDEPVVSIKSTFEKWEGGQITIEAEASDVDGSVPSVQFEYSFNSVDWTSVGVTTAAPPLYSIEWDTKTAVQELQQTVWIRARAIDADDETISVEDTTPKSFGIDNQPPVLGDWTKSPEDLTEDTEAPLRVQVNVDDGIGSGVAKVEVAYRIGTRLNRSFREMTKGSDNLWYFDIPQPTVTWDEFRGEILYYKARATDTVGNVSPETAEQEELIDDINDPPIGVITSTFKDWEGGSLTIRANAADDDGEVAGLQFQYSPDNVNWSNIGAVLTNVPYTATWNSTNIDADPDVWLRAMITDDDGASTEVPYPDSIGIDNSPPAFANWSHTDLTEDSTESFFRVEVEITDRGSGLDNSQVQLDYRIGTSGYTGYRNMFKKTGDVWFYEVPRPGAWSTYAGKTLYYKVRAVDIAGNPAESEERSEFIDSTTGSISGTISPRDSWFNNAKVAARQNNQDVKQVSVSQIDGSYSITGLSPGRYDLVVTAIGYGEDRSMTNVEVKAGQDSPNNNVELYTYAVEQLTRSQGGSVEFKDSQLKAYKLVVDRNVLGRDGEVVLGFSGKEPTGIPNPEVHLLGESIGVGFEGKALNGSLELMMPRPSGISDGKAIMTFIYDGSDQGYRFVDREAIATTDTAITITIDPEDVRNFSDQNHDFDETLSRTTDTVFYVFITRFDEPQISSSDLGILDPQISFGQIASYREPAISSSDRTIALVIHGITSKPDNLVDIIGDLRALNYYNKVLVFNYDPKNTVGSNSDLLMAGLSDELPDNFGGKIDVVAHGMGGLIARSAISTGGDAHIGSLVMLGTPNGGVDDVLLRAGYANFLTKTQSDPAWTYYRAGWQDILAGSAFLASLNSQSGTVGTHYFGIAASNGATSESADNDGLVYLRSADFTDDSIFPNLEQPLTEAFEKVLVALPSSEGAAFMSRTRHVAMLDSPDVSQKVTAYLRGRSQDIRYERFDGELIPGQRIENFTVVLKNVGTETVYGVSAQLSTQNIYIRKYSGAQGIEKDTASFGDIPAGSTRSSTFSFDVSSTAASAFGEQVTFKLLIKNSRDNSTFIEEFVASIGGNLIQIAVNQAGAKMVEADVARDASRPGNDGDPAVEPEEILRLIITLKNKSSSSIPSVKAILKTTDTRVVGLDTTDTQVTEVDMAEDGIEVVYGNMSGGATKALAFDFVKIRPDFTPLGDQVHFTVDIKSGENFFGSDEFDVRVGPDIFVADFDVDEDLKPGGTPRDIDVDLENITASSVEDVEVRIDWSPNVVDIDNDREEFSQIGAGRSVTASFETQVDADFTGYVTFTIEIEVDRVLKNIETYRHYFGKRSHFVAHWLTDDDDDDGIAEQGEDIRLRMARWNPTDDRVDNVEANNLDTADTAIVDIDEPDSDYGDIPAQEGEDSDDDYEFTIADAGDMTVSAGSTDLTETTLEYSNATWIPDAFIGGELNPNTAQSEVFTIIDNDETTITVEAGSDMLAVAAEGDPFSIEVDGDPYNTFELQGRTVEFTVNVEEDREDMGDETVSFRIGGIIRYKPPRGFDALLATIDDDESISTDNNDNGIPEPGETIEIAVTLINITRRTTYRNDVEDVEARLDSDDDVDIDDKTMDYGDIDDDEERTMRYLVEIDQNFEGNIITFTLEIEGRVNGSTRDLGTDTFIIPVLNTQQ